MLWVGRCAHRTLTQWAHTKAVKAVGWRPTQGRILGADLEQ